MLKFLEFMFWKFLILGNVKLISCFINLYILLECRVIIIFTGIFWWILNLVIVFFVLVIIGFWFVIVVIFFMDEFKVLVFWDVFFKLWLIVIFISLGIWWIFL